MRLFANLATLAGAVGLCLGSGTVFGQQMSGQQAAGQSMSSQPMSSQSMSGQPMAGSPATGLAQSSAYRINSGDDLEVNVWGEERLQREVRVLPDGTFTFPLVGQVIAAKRLPSEVAADITNGLKGQYRDNVPTVTVSVKGAGGFQFAVTGKVRGPGIFTPSRYVNVLDALIMAGGPAEFASLDNVVVLRKTADGHVVPIKVRLGRVFKGSASAHDMADLPLLESGDTVVVP